MNPLMKLSDYGQSYWQDSLSRAMLLDGTLRRRVEEQGLRGVTSNPAIFGKAITDSPLYDEQIREGVEAGDNAEAIYRRLAVTDVQAACDILRPVYEETDGGDGFVSLEVSPHLAHDRTGTLKEARELWRAVDRPNLLIKVPGTEEGNRAVEELLYAGINVNITLLFGLDAYRETQDAYMHALERRLVEGKPLERVASVGSFFLSRIDVAVDRRLQHRIHGQMYPDVRGRARSLLGRAAVANAKLAYRSLRETLAGGRWGRLAERGARPQRLVWASTGTKDPTYSDVLYVEPLIGPHTISTMPEHTAAAFADHGKAAETVEQDLDTAREVMEGLRHLGIDFDAVTAQLVDEGVQKFIDPYDALLERIDARSEEPHGGGASEPLVEAMANRLRVDVIRMTTAAGSGHPTSSLSCAEIMAALFFHEMRWDPGNPKARDVDQFILSKGHAAPVLWAALHESGALSEDLMSLRRIDSSLEGHPTPSNPWIKVATGSLGQGLAAANGMALANRMDGTDARVYCLMGDGECSEGSVWEAAQFAADRRLEGLVAIVDVNGLQQSGPAPYGHDTSVLARRFDAFGWRTLQVDGHDVGALLQALKRSRGGGPTAILARTVKGKGVSFLEGARGWHGKALDESQRDAALQELGEDPVSFRIRPRRLGGSGGDSGELDTRMPVRYEMGEQMATRTAFGRALRKLGCHLPELVVLDGDVRNSTKTELFADAFPDRFVEGHIAEQNMVGAALGLAVSGKIPAIATFAAFLTRAFDFVRMAGYSRPAHLVICGSHAGVSIGQDGPSQMGLEDLAMFRSVNGSTVLYPSDAVSAERLTELAVCTEGLVYLRTTRGKTPVIYAESETFEVGGSKTLAVSEQDRLTLVGAGITVHIALEAHRHLLERGVPTRVIDAYSIEPLDRATLQRAARETGTVLVVEDHRVCGGLGDAVSSAVGPMGQVLRLGVTGAPHSGRPQELLRRHHISTDDVEREALILAAA